MRYTDLIKGFLLVALLSVMAACNSDSLTQDADAQPVQINIGTRASYDDSTWEWQDGDKIGLSITNFGEADAKNYTLTYGSSTWNPDNDIIAKLPAKAEAWWPKTDNVSVSQFSFNHTNQYERIQYGANHIDIDGTVDQSTKENLAKNDWMTESSMISSRLPNLTLQHRLAKVTVTITSDEEVKEVRFFSYNPNVPQGVTAVNLDRLLVEPLKNNKTYTAIISAFYYNGDK